MKQKAREGYEGLNFAGLDYFEKLFFTANRTLLPDHELIFDRLQHGSTAGDSAERFTEALSPWAPKYAAVIGFNEWSTNETIRLAATNRVLHVHGAVGPHLSDRDLFPFSFRGQPSAIGEIIAQFYIVAQNLWTSVVTVWNSVGEVDSAVAVAQQHGIFEYTRQHTPGSDRLLWEDITAQIAWQRMRTIMSGIPLGNTIDLVCQLHLSGLRGLQYFFPRYFQVGWWERQGADYPCAPEELKTAAQGHLVVTHTFLAPGTDFLGVIRVPDILPWGDQKNLPLTCSPAVDAQFYYNDMEFYLSILGYGPLAPEEAAEVMMLTGEEYTAMCVTVLALHELLYVQGGSLENLLRRDETTFLDLVKVVEQTQLQGPSGSFKYSPGTGDPEPIYEAVLQFGLASQQPQDAEVFGVVSFARGYSHDPEPFFFRELEWRDGTVGLGPHPNLDLFPNCASENGVLVGDVCQPCEPGRFFDVQSTGCIVCTIGTFQNQSGSTSCSSAPAGTFIEDVTLPANISLCLPGFECPNLGTILPTRCAPGTFAATAGSSRCELCQRGYYEPTFGATQCHQCKDIVCGGTTADLGATESSECSCPEGQYLALGAHAHECKPCPSGMQCKFGSDMQNLPDSSSNYNVTVNERHAYPVVETGYMTLADHPLEVFKCIEDSDACPGGLPGKCGPRREQNIIACGRCDAHSYPTAHTCKSCGLFSALPVVLACLAFVVVLVSVSLVTNFAVQQSPGIATTMSAVIGISVTAIQTLNVLHTVPIWWGEPMDSILSLCGLVHLKSEILQVGCVTGNSPSMKYLYSQLVVPCSIPIIAFILYVERRIAPARIWSGARSFVAFTNTAGTVVSSMLITIVLQSADPLVCYRHLDRSLWSMVSEPSVLCYRSDIGESLAMTLMSATTFMIIPVPFLTVCIYCIVRHPSMMVSPDSQNVLSCTRFLFYRFTPDRYYFDIIILLRSLVLGLIPACFSGRHALKLLTIAVILGLYSVLVQALAAWRVWRLNALDAVVSTLLVVVVVCASLIADDLGDDLRWVQIAAGALVLILITVMAPCLLGGVAQQSKKRIRFEFFICHCKSEAAAQARYLKILMHQMRNGIEIFIDSDNLHDLNELFSIVQTGVRTLLVYLTASTLRRPWCAGEIVTAFEANLRVAPVQTPTFAAPTDMDLRNIEKYLANAHSCNLQDYGIEDEDVVTAFSKLLSTTVFQLKSGLLGTQRFCTLVAEVLYRGMQSPAGFAELEIAHPSPFIRHSASQHGSSGSAASPRSIFTHGGEGIHTRRRLSEAPMVSLLISTLHGSDESTAVGGILKAALAERVYAEMNYTVELSEDLDDTAEEAAYRIGSGLAIAVLVVLSEGSLASAQQVASIIQAWQSRVGLIPIATPGFQYPELSFFEVALPQLLQADEEIAAEGEERAVEAVRGFFRLIAVYFPTNASSQVLLTQGDAVLARLAETLKVSKRGSPTHEPTSRSSRSHSRCTVTAKSGGEGSSVATSHISSRSRSRSIGSRSSAALGGNSSDSDHPNGCAAADWDWVPKERSLREHSVPATESVRIHMIDSDDWLQVMC